jgi:hypothetical protein
MAHEDKILHLSGQRNCFNLKTPLLHSQPINLADRFHNCIMPVGDALLDFAAVACGTVSAIRRVGERLSLQAAHASLRAGSPDVYSNNRVHHSWICNTCLLYHT